MNKQFKFFKEKYPTAILLFRVGDYYEAYEQDVEHVHKAMGSVYQGDRYIGCGLQQAVRFPHYALDTILPKLVRAGHRVAILDPLEDPKKVKKRITELVTPYGYNEQKEQPKKRQEPVQLSLFDF